MTGLRDFAVPIALLGMLLGTIALVLILTFIDARAFADECIAAGGYVADSGTCVR